MKEEWPNYPYWTGLAANSTMLKANCFSRPCSLIMRPCPSSQKACLPLEFYSGATDLDRTCGPAHALPGAG